MSEIELKRDALGRIANRLGDAIKECDEFDDLKESLGKELKELQGKVRKMSIKLSTTISDR